MKSGKILLVLLIITLLLAGVFLASPIQASSDGSSGAGALNSDGVNLNEFPDVTISFLSETGGDGLTDTPDLPDGVLPRDTKDVTVRKVWLDGDDKYSARPDSVVVRMICNENPAITRVATLSADSGWTHEFKEVCVTAMVDGADVAYTYRIEQEGVSESYQNTEASEAGGYTLTSELWLTIKVEKGWPNGLTDSITGVTLKLYRDNEYVTESSVNESDGWSGTFPGKYPAADRATGLAYTYEVREAAVVGYNPFYGKGQYAVDTGELTFVVMNYPAEGLVDPNTGIKLKITKTWIDDDARLLSYYSTRPYVTEFELKVKRRLYGEVDETYNMPANAHYGSGDYMDLELLPRFYQRYSDTGVAYDYYVVEEDIPADHYLPDNAEAPVRGTLDPNVDRCEITNTLQTFDINIQKKWVDLDNTLRPTGPIDLTLRGYISGDVQVFEETKTIDSGVAASEWTSAFTELPRYVYHNYDYQKITYVLTESGIGDDYTLAGSVGSNHITLPYADSNVVDVTLENVLKGLPPNETEVEINKYWDDEDHILLKEGFSPRPPTLSVALKRRAITTDPVTGSTEKVEDAGFNKTLTLEPSPNITDLMEVTSDKVESWDENLNPYEYYIEELGIPEDHYERIYVDMDLNLIARPSGGRPGWAPVHVLDFMNSLQTFDIRVHKLWENNTSPSQPVESITLTLRGYIDYETNNPTLVLEQKKEITERSGLWNHVFRDALRYVHDGGEFKKITYTITEEDVPGYKLEAMPGLGDNLTFLDDHTVLLPYYAGDSSLDVELNNVPDTLPPQPKTRDITVTKVWNDGDDPLYTGLRPDPIEIVLTNETSGEVYRTDLSATGGWTYTFTDLSYEDGDVFSATETAFGTDYIIDQKTTATDDEGNVTGITFTNTVLREIKVKKTWSSVDIIPPEITITLYAGDEELESLTLSDSLGWERAFTKKYPVYDADGNKIAYSVKESSAFDGQYVATISGPEYTTDCIKFSVHNTGKTPPNPGMTTVTVMLHKFWPNEETSAEAYPTHPEPFTLTLKREVGGEEDKTFSMDVPLSYDAPPTDPLYPMSGDVYGLPATDINGQKYTYYAVEEGLPDDHYDCRIDDAMDMSNGPMILAYNTLLTFDVNITKAWAGEDGDASGRPTAPITLTLQGHIADGEGTLKVRERTFEISAEDAAGAWSHTFTGLPRYVYHDKGYRKITYTLSESAVPGYTLKDSDNGAIALDLTAIDPADGTLYVTLTNEKDTPPPQPKTRDITVTKVWNDGDDPLYTGLRPGSIKIVLTNEGTKKEYEGTLNADGGWTYTFTGLPADNDDVYTAKETAFGTDYSVDQKTTATDSDGNVTGITFTNTLLRDIWIKKIWSGVDGIPPEVTITLYANGVEVDSLTLSDSLGWERAFEKKYPVYDADGNKIVYSVTEWSMFSDRYDANISDPEYTKDYIKFSVHNIGKIPPLVEMPSEKIVIEVTKEWVDGATPGETYSTRPSPFYLTLKRMRSNELDEDFSERVELKYKEGSQTEMIGVSSPVDRRKDNVEYWYFFEENGIPDDHYSVFITNVISSSELGKLKCQVTNTLKTLTVNVDKDWQDADASGRPTDPITVTLTGQIDVGGVTHEVVSRSQTIRTDVTTDWSVSFGDLPRYIYYEDAFRKVSYSVRESDVPGYTLQNGDQGTVSIAYGSTDGEVSVTLENAPIPPQKTPTKTLTLTKKWVDAGWETMRPEQGVLVEIKGVTSTDEKTYARVIPGGAFNWKLEVPNLPAFDDKGEEYVYTVRETVPKGYEQVEIVQPEKTGDNLTATLTNKLSPISVSVKKVWSGIEAASAPAVTIELKADGTTVGTLTLSKSAGWSMTVNGLPRYNAKGNEIAYTVVERVDDAYTASVEKKVGSAGAIEFTITNTLKTPTPTSPPPSPTRRPGPTSTPQAIVLDTPPPGATPPPAPLTSMPPMPESSGRPARNVRVYTNISEFEVPLGAGLNLNLGDCFD